MKNNLVSNVTVIDLADKGKTVGKIDEKAVFIEGAVPGDVVDLEIYKRSKSFDEARVVKITTHSPWRTTPVCEHFGLCGGCKWQQLEYSAQLRFKEKNVRDAMERIARLITPVIEPITGSKNIYQYRNKLEFTFTNKRYLLKEEMNDSGIHEMNGLGFHIPGKFNKVLNINNCHLQDGRSDEIRNFVKQYAIENKLTFFDLKSQEGLLRNLIIRNTTLDEWMVVVVFKEDVELVRNELLNALKNNFPWINSIQYIINTKRNDSLHDQQPVLFHGDSFITEQLEDLRFRISPKSFFQTNSLQGLELYRITRNFAGLTGSEVVYDLYTGTGSIAAFVSGKAKKVVGVEYVQEAIDDANENAKLNNISNMIFFAGDMKDVLTKDFFQEHGKPDVIITDPPRAGMHEDVVRRINESGADRVVYVSCNPATQARDLLLMNDHYSVAKIQPVDMFPHTSHVENVVLLVKK
jgi:23S rRNA (uracil1939-C5)-methyltransferase